MTFLIQRRGFFIECGALDGETRSNSLFLEMVNEWTGILIEADPMSLVKIRYIRGLEVSQWEILPIFVSLQNPDFIQIFAPKKAPKN